MTENNGEYHERLEFDRFCPIAHANACRSLFQAVLLLAIKDANERKSLQQATADAWIRGGGKRFRLICRCAGLNPEKIREKYISMKNIKVGRRI